jgi:hypothetical protein
MQVFSLQSSIVQQYKSFLERLIQIKHKAIREKVENDRVRFTIHPDARWEVLKRRLEQNHKIYSAKVALGLHDKKKVKTARDDVRKNNDASQGKLF